MKLLNYLKSSCDLKKYLLDKENYEQISILEEAEQANAAEGDKTCAAPENLRKLTYQYIIKNIGNMTDVVLGQDVLNDIELVKSYDGGMDTVLNKIDMTCLIGSKHYLERVVCNPVFNATILQKRKALLMRVESLAGSNSLVLSKLQNMAPYENDIAWLYNCSDDDMSSLYDMVYFRYWFVNHLNKHESALTFHNLYRIMVSPVIGIVSPITYFVIPYFVLRYKYGLPLGFFTYLRFTFSTLFSNNGLLSQFSPNVSKFKYVSYAFSLLFYFQSMFNSVEIARASFKIARMITNRINNIVEFIKSGKYVHDQVWGEDFSSMFDISVSKATVFDNTVSYFDEECLAPFRLLSNFGKQLKIFKNFKRDAYLPLINRCYMIDCLMGIVSAKQKLNLSIPDFVTSGDPCLNLQGMWHPCLDQGQVVKNDVVLGSDNQDKTRNMMLTGPNAGGKSTLIKSVVISIIMSQTVVVVNADSARLSPFKYINSQIHIPDCKGKESLFEAEMYRSKSNFEQLEMIDKQPSFIVMDEIFNSTNPIEGIAGAYAIAKSLGAHESNLSIISTHYVYLTRLAKETKLFKNYKMNVILRDGTIEYPYKMSRGVSRQYIALELLKKNGFDTKIIEEGMRIKERLLAPTVV